MRNFIVKIRFLIYAAVLFAAASLLESYLSGRKSYEIDKSRVEKILHAKEAELDNIATDFLHVFSVSDSAGIQSVPPYNSDFENIASRGFSLLIYKNDTLVFWTDNIVSADKLYSRSGLYNRIANLNNAWYEIRTLKSGNTTVVGLIFLKNKYNYSNRYLKNDFLDGFNLPPTVQVSMIPLSYGWDIADNEGKYIFSLVPTNSFEFENRGFILPGVLFLASLIMFMFFILKIIKGLKEVQGSVFKISGIISSVIAGRLLLFVLKFPPNLYSLDIFDPVYFSGSLFFGNLGDFIINAVIALFVIVYFFELTDSMKLAGFVAKLKRNEKLALCIFSAVVWCALFSYAASLMKMLVTKSNISFDFVNFFSLDIFSISGILIFVLIFFSTSFAAVRMFEYFDFSDSLSLLKTMIVVLIAGGMATAVCFVAGESGAAFIVAYISLTFITLLASKRNLKSSRLYYYIFLVFISAIFTAQTVIIDTEAKRNSQCEDMVSGPVDYHDHVAEGLLKNISSDILKDETVSDFLAGDNILNRDNRLREYFRQQYFNGYWSKYDMNLNVVESVAAQQSAYSQTDFSKSIDSSGLEVESTDFYFVQNANESSISYSAPLKYIVRDKIYIVCIKLTFKHVPAELGYPELLMDEKDQTASQDNYDFACYRNGRLISHSGSFSYDLADKYFIDNAPDNASKIYRIKTDDRLHIVGKSGDTLMVVSRVSFTFFDALIAFAYLFVAFMTVLMLFWLIKTVVKKETDFRYKLKTRMIFSITSVLLISFVFICIGSAYLSVNRFKKDTSEAVDEKMKSVYMELETVCGDSAVFNTVWDPAKNSALDDYLTRISHILFIDVNLYNPSGELIASSRPEIFKLGLTSTLMNPMALRKLYIDNKADYITNESIGKLGYTSAYIPFFNREDKITAFINLPYFTKPSAMQSEFSTLIVSIVNLYVVLMMFSIVVAVLVSERIVQPIKMIQSKLEKTELGRKHEKIEYNRKDELGQLVTEYNKMAQKLEESAELLARSERERAWREMAKQIAHEIKNPLTPMKLSIQFLMRSRENNDPGFDNVLKKVSDTLVQQIDTLSSIATEFSNFAKMPKPDEQPFNIIETLQNVVLLFNNLENVDITSDMSGFDNLIVTADKEQISRVFINIIKNASQAIPEGVRGKIHVKVEAGEKFVVKISDNGCGIPQDIRGKLFTPSFTTKSSGSGLGLAMCKNIIVNAHGDITFESSEGVGTTFIISLPLSEKN